MLICSYEKVSAMYQRRRGPWMSDSNDRDIDDLTSLFEAGNAGDMLGWSYGKVWYVLAADLGWLVAWGVQICVGWEVEFGLEIRGIIG